MKVEMVGVDAFQGVVKDSERKIISLYRFPRDNVKKKTTIVQTQYEWVTLIPSLASFAIRYLHSSTQNMIG